MRTAAAFLAGALIAAVGTACGLIAWASRDVRRR